MNLDLEKMTPRARDEAVDFFEENGYLTLTGVDGPITDGFRRVLADTIGVRDDEMLALLEPRSGNAILPVMAA